MFTLIRRRDVLLHHPFQSFQPVVDFLRQAARDPDVLAIKVVLYRVGRNSPVVEALLEAIEEGKQVAVLMELKARFDEESNIEWAKTLEKAGCHVVYGLLGLKIHCKAAMVLRREGDAIRPYLHLATGNYNVVTAHLYTDVGTVHLQSRDRRGHHRSLQLPDRLLRQARLSETAGGAGQSARAPGSADRARDRAACQGRQGPPGLQDERAGGSADDPLLCIGPRRPASGSTCWCAASAACGPAFRASATPSG